VEEYPAASLIALIMQWELGSTMAEQQWIATMDCQSFGKQVSGFSEAP